MSKVYSFDDLTCWKKARSFRSELYQLAKKFPPYEERALASQIRRASVSVTANIAEGYGRYSYTEKIQFTRFSRASVLELQDHLYTCLDAGYFTKEEFEFFYAQSVEVEKSINGYMGYIAEQRLKNRLS